MTLLVHTSFRSIGPIDGGAETLLAAFNDVLGPKGTLVVPTFTPGNSLSSRTFRERIHGLSAWGRFKYVCNMPGFDPDSTVSEGVGWFAEYVRNSPKAVRSLHPQTSFAAQGALASWLMAEHDPGCLLGERSPLARLYQAGARILMIGCGFGACTAFHLAEHRFSARAPRQVYHCVVAEGRRRQWRSYLDVLHDDSDFPQLGAALEAHGSVTVGNVGRTVAKMTPFDLAVDFAVRWMAENR